jgi:hypothetical protein
MNVNNADLPVSVILGMQGEEGILFEIVISQWTSMLIPGKD